MKQTSVRVMKLTNKQQMHVTDQQMHVISHSSGQFSLEKSYMSTHVGRVSKGICLGWKGKAVWE